jgi:hypothetical protein
MKTMKKLTKTFRKQTNIERFEDLIERSTRTTEEHG